MQDLSLHVLDIVENSIRAGAGEVEIRINEDIGANLLEIEIRDDGAGMDQATLVKVLDPFYTTKSVRKVGLGLSLFREAARAAAGDMTVQSEPGNGTRVKATFQHSHVDRQPLGDMAKTLEILIIANPEVRFRYRHLKDGEEEHYDSERFETESIGSPGLAGDDTSRLGLHSEGSP